jgi:hypothetical protein
MDNTHNVTIVDAVKPTQRISGWKHASEEKSVFVFSPDSSRLAVCSTIIEIRDAATGAMIGNVVDPGARVLQAWFSKDGKALTTLTERAITEWGEAVRVVLKAPEHVSLLAADPAGVYALATGAGGVTFIEIATGKKAGQVEGAQDLSADKHIVFVGNGRTVVWPVGGAIRCWTVPGGERTLAPLLDSNVWMLTPHPDRLVVFAQNMGGVSVWDLRVGEMIERIAWSDGRYTTGFTVSPDGLKAAMMGLPGAVALLSLADLIPLASAATISEWVRTGTGGFVNDVGQVKLMTAEAWRVRARK